MDETETENVEKLFKLRYIIEDKIIGENELKKNSEKLIKLWEKKTVKSQ